MTIEEKGVMDGMNDFMRIEAMQRVLFNQYMNSMFDILAFWMNWGKNTYEQYELLYKIWTNELMRYVRSVNKRDIQR